MPTLNWLGDDKAKQIARHVPYRLLETVSQHGDAESGNLLIQGDNLEALKALLPFYAGQVKCIFIDPPYNTKSAFEHYDDNLEHSQWLSMMYPRLELLRDLLAEDGFIVVHIDDSESHYLKVILDEIFSRKNYQASIYVQVRYTSKTLKSDMDYHKQVEQALVYRKSFTGKPYRPATKIEGFDKFNFDIAEITPGEEILLSGKKVTIFKKGQYSINKVDGHVNGLKEIWATGSILDGNSSGRFFRDYLAGRSEADGLGVLYKVENIGDDGIGYRYFTGPNKIGATKGKYFQGVPLEKRNLESQDVSAPIENFYDFSPQFGNCRQEGDVDFRSGKKPEAYLQKVLELFTKEDDIVLDSFLGSGSTAATAHKMHRKWIGIELGTQANTHCLPRLTRVVHGEQSGISKPLNWQGGGGFRFMQLGEPAFMDDGRINPSVRFATLAAYLWFLDTKSPHATGQFTSPVIGTVGEEEMQTAYVLLYNGILGDRRPNGGNVLTSQVWDYLKSLLPEHTGRWVIYGEASRMPEARRKAKNIEFRQIPYEIRLR